MNVEKHFKYELNSTLDIAESKVREVRVMASEYHFPLLCTIEEDN